MKKLFFLGLSLIALNATAQSVAINTDGSTAHPSAILDLKSSNQGVLVPRMTQVQRSAITSPATGLIVYQTDETAGFYFHNGMAWTTLNGANGQGLPIGGTTGQVLAKVDNTNFNTQWTTPSGSSARVVFKGILTSIGNTANNLTLNANNGILGRDLSCNFGNILTQPEAGVISKQLVNGTTTIVPVQPTALVEGFLIQQSGLYQISCSLAVSGATNSTATNNGTPIPVIEFNPGNSSSFIDPLNSIHGVGFNGGTNNFTVPSNVKGRGQVNTVLYFNAGDSFNIFVHNGSVNNNATLNSNMTSNLVVVKL